MSLSVRGNLIIDETNNVILPVQRIDAYLKAYRNYENRNLFVGETNAVET